MLLLKALLLALVHRTTALAAPSPYQVLRAASVIDPLSGKRASPLAGINQQMMLARGVRGRSLVVVLPQLGEFDSVEYCEQLVAVLDDLRRADMTLRIIGIGDAAAARRFAAFSGLPLSCLRADPDGALHAALGLHDGPRWGFPDWAPDFALGLLLRSLPGGPPADSAAVREAANAWLRYFGLTLSPVLDSAAATRPRFDLYKIFVHFQAVVHDSVILLLPPTTCIAHTIAILVHGDCAINDSSPTPPFVSHTPYNGGRDNIV